MILIDTTVWVYSFRPTHPEIIKRVREFLRDDMPYRHDFIQGELSLGKGGNTRKEIMDLYSKLRRLETLPHEAVMSFIKKHDLANKGIGYIDVHLLAAAHSNSVKLWTEDKALKAAATALGVAYEFEKVSAT